jgi:putative Ca2+/H+ antiporter (TMEM165/GDT1 family)
MFDIIQAFAIIFIAELGDKSQLLAMTLATKYKTRTVLIGVFLGISVNHLLAVGLGSALQQSLQPTLTSIIVAIIFIVFGISGVLQPPHQEKITVYHLPPVFAVALLFFLGEMGDKTQFTTLALSMQSDYPWTLLIGTIGAMMTTSYLAILVGQWMGKKFPEFLIKVISTFIFILYGLFRLYSIINSLSMWILLASITFIVVTLLLVRYRRIEQEILSDLKQVAQTLKDYYNSLANQVDTICLGEEICGSCLVNGCLIGYVKYLIEKGKHGDLVSTHALQEKALKEVDKKKVIQALELTVSELKNHWSIPTYTTLHEIRKALEYILFETTIKADTYESYNLIYQTNIKNINSHEW